MYSDSLKQLIERLQLAKEADDWDIGDICLAQCSEAVATITAAFGSSSASSNSPGLAALMGQSIAGENLELYDFGNLNFFPYLDLDVANDLQYC